MLLSDFFFFKKINENFILLTGVPRLTRFLVARFHFTRIFEAAQKDFRITDL